MPDRPEHRCCRLTFLVATLWLAGCATSKGGSAQPAAPAGVRSKDQPANAAHSLAPATLALQDVEHRLGAQLSALVKRQIGPDTGMHLTDVSDADVDSGETIVVTGSEDKTARIWTLDNGRQLAVLRIPGQGPIGKIHAVAMAPNGREVAIGGWEGKVYIFRAPDWRLVREVRPDSNSVDSLRYSPEGARLAVGLWSRGGIRILETERYTEVFRDPDYGADCYGLSFSRAGLLAVASWDRTVRVYSPDHVLLARKEFPTRAFRLAFDPAGERLLVGFLDTMTVRLLSVPRLDVLKEVSISTGDPEVTTLGTVDWSRDGTQFFAGGRNHRDGWNPILRWSRDGTRLDDWRLNRNTPSRLVGLKGGALLVASQDPLVGVLNPGGGVRWSHRSPTADFTGQARTFRLSADASVVQFAWDRNGTKRITFDVRSLKAISPEASPPLRPAVSAQAGFDLANWENRSNPTIDGQRLAVARFETCRAVAIDAAHERFLLGCEWNVYMFRRSGLQQWRLAIPASARAVQLSEDGHLAVVARDDGTIRWLDAETGAERLALLFLGEAGDWVAWTPEGFFAGTTPGEAILGIQGLSKDGAAKFIPLSEVADALRRPDLIRQAVE
jgi:hypothetical protein